MSEPIVRREFEARGRVQRVGYRDFVEEVARTLGLRGTVANDDPDEHLVRIVAQGSAETLEDFVREISGRHGFADAQVRLVQEAEADAALVEFVKLRGPEGKEMLERADQSVLLLGRIF
ncbi:Acylphosphatase domain protein, partial [mine drainage metagenome]